MSIKYLWFELHFNFPEKIFNQSNFHLDQYWFDMFQGKILLQFISLNYIFIFKGRRFFIIFLLVECHLIKFLAHQKVSNFANWNAVFFKLVFFYHNSNQSQKIICVISYLALTNVFFSVQKLSMMSSFQISFNDY